MLILSNSEGCNRQKLNGFKNISLIFDNNVIERVDTFKYLGIIFDPHLSWNNHVQYLSSNISKRIGIIRRVKYDIPHIVLSISISIC